MFSLIITIISIALVAALALATIYYGGDAFENGTVQANASKIINQGQQLLGAAEMYKANTGDWPEDVDVLISSGYLKAIPEARMGVVSEALAATPWVMASEGLPVFLLSSVGTPVCQEVNRKSYGLDGILAQIRTSLATQCYGAAGQPATVVIAKSGEHLAAAALDPLATALGVVTNDAIPNATDIAAWATPPTLATAGNGSGSGTGGGTGGGTVTPPVTGDGPVPGAPGGPYRYNVTVSLDGVVTGLPRRDVRRFTANSPFSTNLFVTARDSQGPYYYEDPRYPPFEYMYELFSDGGGAYIDANDGEYYGAPPEGRPVMLPFTAPVTYRYTAHNFNGYYGSTLGFYVLDFPVVQPGANSYEFCATFVGMDPAAESWALVSSGWPTVGHTVTVGHCN